MRRYSKLNLFIIIVITLIIALSSFIFFSFKNKQMIDKFSSINSSSFSENIEYINVKYYHSFNNFKNKLLENACYLFDEKLYIDNPNNIYTIQVDDENINISLFISKILPTINHEFILLCVGLPRGASYYVDYINLIANDKNCLQIFCQNLDIINNKCKPIPLGIDYHTLYVRKGVLTQWTNKNKVISPQDQELELINIKNSLKHPFNREAKAYTSANLTCSDNKPLHNYGGHREKIKILFKNSDYVKLEKNKILRVETWKKHNDYLFILSPPGNGLDCHRTWEALILGNIPILISTDTEFDTLFEDLPVILIKDYSEVTKENLNKWKSNFIKDYNKFNFEKLTCKYWEKYILSFLNSKY